jgi:carbamate kinase
VPDGAAGWDEYAAFYDWENARTVGRRDVAFWQSLTRRTRGKILELGAVRSLLDAGFVVVAAGGGGIAVVENAAGEITGAAAVIDKDHASSLLARQLGAELFVVSTAVEKVSLAFGTPQQVDIDRMTVAQARRYVAEGHFKPGSMRPKIEAIIAFLEGGGREAIITNPAHIGLALAGEAGTHIVP